MKKQNRAINQVLKTFLFLAVILYSSPILAQSVTYSEDVYAALLSRMVEKGTKSDQDAAFLESTQYWPDLWEVYHNSDTWTKMMNNATLFTQSTTEYDRSTGKTYALVTISDRVAWLAFPGVSTDANMDSGIHGAFITWPRSANADPNKDVHAYFYGEWTKLRDNGLATWFQDHNSAFDKLIVAGHSKGGVLSQYFMADYAPLLPDKIIHFVAFGSPNAGSEAFIQEWANRPNLKRVKFYTTQGAYIDFWGKPKSIDDMITYEALTVNAAFYYSNADILHDITVYPRGLSRAVGKYVSDCSSKLQRQYLQVDGAKFDTKLPVWEAYAKRIHDDSYYLSGLEDAYFSGDLDPVSPTDLVLPSIRLAAAQTTAKCIDNAAGGLSDGNNILIWTCGANNQNQEWFLKNGTIRLARNTEKCLDLNQSNTANGTNIQLWTCNGSDAQRWTYDGLTKNIRSKVNSGKCLDLVNANTTNGTNIQIWDCKEISAQKWNIAGATTVSNVSNKQHIVPVLAPTFAVHSHTGAESGSNIQLWTKDNTNTAEQWYFDGLAIKMRDHQNLCIDLNQSNTDNGNNIQLYNCNGSNAQKWLYDGMTRSIRSVINPDKCMQIKINTDGAYGKRSNVDIQDCNGSDVQQFLIQE
ncbi:MAG: ricin-type beta-trefoil lectin domain protein [Lewinellaceae bacterium]|nr:ricin-type beta-trefoil lectin domain protein [Lewinellaceae bacterium]